MIIFFFSIIFSLIFLIIERTFGIGIDYHPDSSIYLEALDMGTIKDVFDNPVNFLGSLFYVIINSFDKNTSVFLAFNITIFAITNLMMFLIVKNILYKNGFFYFIFSLILIFDPYRAHLSIHILKDTLIIFSLISTLYFLNIFFNIFSIFFIILGSLLRSQFYAYLIVILPFLNRKSFYSIGIFFFLLICFQFSAISEFFLNTSNIDTKGQVSLAFRDFDTIPNFVEFQYPYGGILRAFIWPFIRFFNFAAIFHPIYALFMLQSLALILLLFYNRYFLNYKFLIFYIILAVTALSAPGYNTFLRYSQPIMTVLYIWVISIRNIDLKSGGKKN